MGFGTRLQSARKQAGLTQDELKARMGWQSQAIVSKYENEGSEPSLPDFQKLGVILQVSPSWLAFGDEFTAPSNKALKIDLEKIGDYGGGQGSELFNELPKDGIYYLALQSIVGFAETVIGPSKAVIQINTTLPNHHYEGLDDCIYLFFEDKGGEYQRIRRELHEYFSLKVKESG